MHEHSNNFMKGLILLNFKVTNHLDINVGDNTALLYKYILILNYMLLILEIPISSIYHGVIECL